MLPVPCSNTLSKLDCQDNSINLRTENKKNIHQSNLEKLSSSLKNKFNLSQVTADETANKIMELQKNLKDGKCLQIQPTELIPIKLILTNRYLIGVEENIGTGSYADVFKAVLFPTERHQLGRKQLSPSQPEKLALKKTKVEGFTFSPERRLLECRGLVNKREIDGSLATLKSEGGRGFSLHELYDVCLSNAQFSQMQAPVLAILQVLIQVADGIRFLHNSGTIHRDIKGPNILVKIEAENLADLSPHLYKENIKVALTDFGLLKLKPISKPLVNHKTCGTPLYLDPTMFGDAKENLCNQKKRWGLQTEEGDIFAFGITIIYDVLLKFLTQKLQQLESTIGVDTEAKTSVNEIIAKCKSKIKKGPFTDTDLQILGEKYAFRAMHAIINKTEEVIIIYPRWSKLNEKLKEAIKVFPTLTQEEVSALTSISSLACEMLEKKMKIDKIILSLHLLQKFFKRSLLQDSKTDGSIDRPEKTVSSYSLTQESSSSLKKRPLNDTQIAEEDPSVTSYPLPQQQIQENPKKRPKYEVKQ